MIHTMWQYREGTKCDYTNTQYLLGKPHICYKVTPMFWYVKKVDDKNMATHVAKSNIIHLNCGQNLISVVAFHGQYEFRCWNQCLNGLYFLRISLIFNSNATQKTDTNLIAHVQTYMKSYSLKVFTQLNMSLVLQ